MGAGRRRVEEARPAGPSALRVALLASALVAFGALAYANGLASPFVFDDIPQIVQSETLVPIWPGLATFLGRQRTVTALTFAWNHALGGFEPFGYHLVNLAIHLLAGLCLFGIVRRALGLARFAERRGDIALPFAWSVAALWIVHPLQTESVTYMVQRSECLMGLFYLLTLYCVLRAATGARPRAWQALAVLACALGMGSKPVMVTAPIVALCFDRVFLSASWAALLRQRGWMHAGLALGWLLVAATGLVGLLLDPEVARQGAAGFGMEDVSVRGYLLTQSRVLLHYLRLALWPVPLVLDYRWPIESTLVRALPAASVVLVALAATGIGLARRSWAGFLGAWFFLILAPTSSFVPLRDAAFEHRMYLPLAALVIFAVAGALALGRMAIRRGLCSVALARGGAGLGMLLGLACLGWRTRERNRDYQSSLALWESTVAHAPTNGRAHNLLAQSLAEAGRLDETIDVLRRGLEAERAEDRGPGDPVARALRVNLASSLLRAGRPAEALEFLRSALAEAPGDAQMQRQLGLALSVLGQQAQALDAYRRAVALAPEDPVGHRELAVLLHQGGDPGGARAALAEARRLAPDDLETRALAARLLLELGDLAGAEQDFRAALLRRPGDPAFWLGLGLALEGQGRLGEARASFERTLSLRPGDPEARRALERCRADPPGEPALGGSRARAPG